MKATMMDLKRFIFITPLVDSYSYLQLLERAWRPIRTIKATNVPHSRTDAYIRG